MTPSIPTEYEAFLATHGPFEGFTTGNDSPGYIALWSLAELPARNAEIEIQKYAPGMLAFASDGAGEVLAFDRAGAVYMLPLVGMEPASAIHVARSFNDLAIRFERVA